MTEPDIALQVLREIVREFADFVREKGSVSESDTRAKLIDRVLIQVCGWPEPGITREEHVDSGFIDYSLTLQTRRYVAVEAKKEGSAFTLPNSPSRTLKLSGSLVTDKAVKSAIEQVRAYCDDAGIRYAIATNGYSWIVFRAIREDIPWREGNARIFPSLEHVEQNFTDFWNLLSFDAIRSGALDEEFGPPRKTTRRLSRVVTRLFKADLPLQRNRLHAQLHPLIQTIFQDIAAQEPVEILRSCYVHLESLKIVAQDLKMVITDSIPHFLKQEGAEGLEQEADDAGRFGDAMAQALTRHSGQLYLVLGGIGSGKTTFIKRFQRTVGKEILDSRALWFHLDFLEAPIDPTSLEDFVWRGMLEQLRSRYVGLNIETRRNIKKAFADKIQVVSQTTRAFRMRAGEFENELSPYLEKWVEEIADYAPRLLRVAQANRGRQVVLFVDNVDQLSPAHQAQVFVLAERVTRIVGAVSVLALREESYYTASIQKTLTAYTSRKFHIASPNFRKLIDNRIKFALQVLETSSVSADYVLKSGITIDKADIAEFLRIIETSIFQRNANIARFIEALCFGNMREALDMFTMFMTSGATDVDKMLAIHRKSGAYYVAFHEFVKSIMLGERQYYKDQASAVMNIFDCGADRNSSHFTCLRIVQALSTRRGEWNKEGQGFVDVSQLISMFEDVFDNREDVLRSLNRLVAKQLIEANTKSTESIDGASHVRVTPAGWYFSRFLVKAFSYLDLVLQDTPINDLYVADALLKGILDFEKIPDREDLKLERLSIRFSRVRSFLDYLAKEEENEQQQYDLKKLGGLWSEPFVPGIREQIENELAWIEHRLAENRERYAEEIRIGADDVIDDSLEPPEHPQKSADVAHPDVRPDQLS